MGRCSSAPARNEVLVDLFLLGEFHLLPVALVVGAPSALEAKLPDDECENGDEDDSSDDSSGNRSDVGAFGWWCGCDEVVVFVHATRKGTSIATGLRYHAHLIGIAGCLLASHDDSLFALYASFEYGAHDVVDVCEGHVSWNDGGWAPAVKAGRAGIKKGRSIPLLVMDAMMDGSGDSGTMVLYS